MSVRTFAHLSQITSTSYTLIPLTPYFFMTDLELKIMRETTDLFSVYQTLEQKQP